MTSSIKIIHVPFGFHPDPVGGTEVYVESLCRALKERGLDSIITAPGTEASDYVYKGLRVRRFAVSNESTDLLELYGEGDRTAAGEFSLILDEEKPDLVHLHAFTSGVSLRLLREAKRRGIKVVFTYHTPTVSCQRGTLLRWGDEVCDGVLELRKCAECALHGHGLGKAKSRALGFMPAPVGRMIGSAGLSGRAWTALRMTELVQFRQAAFRALMREAHSIIALCQWAKDLLSRNDVPAEKIFVSRHGLPRSEDPVGSTSAPLSLMAEPLRIAFLGRLDRTKGAEMLISALRSLSKLSVELHLYGIAQGDAGKAYLKSLKHLSGDDPRIAFLPAVPSTEVISLLKSYHLLAVPSQWLETGPLVVLEAFAAGIPVLGSKLGGIAELVRHETDGLLVDPSSVEAWISAIRRCAEDRSLLSSLRQGIRPPRTMEAVAREMSQLYERVLGSNLKSSEQASMMEGIHAHG